MSREPIVASVEHVDCGSEPRPEGVTHTTTVRVGEQLVSRFEHAWDGVWQVSGDVLVASAGAHLVGIIRHHHYENPAWPRVDLYVFDDADTIVEADEGQVCLGDREVLVIPRIGDDRRALCGRSSPPHVGDRSLASPGSPPPRRSCPS